MDKTLIIIDFDNTLVDLDVDWEIVKYFLPEVAESLPDTFYQENDWLEFMQENYIQMKQKGYSINDINKFVSSIPLTNHFKHLCKYLGENKNKFYTIILSGSTEYNIHAILNANGVEKCFDEIICNKSILDKDSILKLIPVGYGHNCKDCNKNQCKTYIYNQCLKGKFKKIIFICDGSNDLCLAKRLNHNDILYTRINHKLYNFLIKNRNQNCVNCSICPWNNGNDIFNLIKYQ